MKKIKIHLTILLLLAFFTQGFSLEKIEEIKGSYKLKRSNNYSEIKVRNINGSINIESYNGSEVKIVVTKTIIAKRESDLKEGFSELNIKVYEHEKGLFIYMDHPCANFDEENLELNYDCGHHWRWDDDYDFHFDFEIKIPKGVSYVSAGTINKGNVFVQDLECELDLNNVNGSVEAVNHSGNVKAHTVNGDIDIEFTKNPDEFATFNTINGNVNIYCKSDLSANIQFQSMNGEFYTDFDISDFLPAVVKTSRKGKRSSTKYSLKSIKKFNVGSGKVDFSFKTLNGHMYLRKNN